VRDSDPACFRFLSELVGNAPQRSAGATPGRRPERRVATVALVRPILKRLRSHFRRRGWLFQPKRDWRDAHRA